LNASTVPVLKCSYLGEPLLEFAEGGKDVDPKGGIARFGPKSLRNPKRHPEKVRVGIIGTAESVSQAKEWIEVNSAGVVGDEDHPSFPGCMSDRGFHTELEISDAWAEKITRSELDTVLRIKDSEAAFSSALGLLDSKLSLLAQKDLGPEYVIVAIPDELRNKVGVVNIRRGSEYFHRDLRRAFKASAMKFRIPTQLVDPTTIEFRDPDNPSKIAWNFFTGLYFKAGGMPWGPTGLAPGSCYMGVSFYRGLNAKDPKIHTSLVQAFDENGDGLVLRGPDFEWDANKHQSRTPHLRAEDAFRITEIILDRYQKEMKQLPRRVVVHKTSRWSPEESAGFAEALKKRVHSYDLVALQSQSAVRILPSSQYPALRGTRFTIEQLDYLYTTGFIAELGQFHGQHVPAPVQVADHIGFDTPREEILKELLVLTKMNWNAARLGGQMPITVKFARLVGEIMRELPADGPDPLPQSKFYM
jgi:hypothetical protein